MVLPLKLFEQARAPQNLRVETFSRQEQYCEIRSARRHDVLFADGPRELTNPSFQRLARRHDAVDVALVRSVEQPLIILLWELGINWEQDLVFAVATGQPNGELDAFLRIFPH